MDVKERTCLTLSSINLFCDPLQQKGSRIHLGVEPLKNVHFSISVSLHLHLLLKEKLQELVTPDVSCSSVLNLNILRPHQQQIFLLLDNRLFKKLCC